MTKSLSETRAAAAAAHAARNAAAMARDLFKELFTLSTEQGDALHREDFTAFERLLNDKDAVLQKLDMAMAELHQAGWELDNPATYPRDAESAAALREATELSRKVQAHERYLIAQLVAQQQFVGERLNAILKKRQAASVYAHGRPRGDRVDTSR